MVDSKTCKYKRKPNWTQEQLLHLAQVVNEYRIITRLDTDLTRDRLGMA